MSKNVLYAWVDLISPETAIWGEYYKKIYVCVCVCVCVF